MSRKPLILCVDDNPDILKGQQMVLEQNGYRVLTATNGADALKAFSSNSVDLVVLDYHMPGMSGALAAARMKDLNTYVPIALVSSDESLLFADLGAVDCFLSKSDPISVFLNKVSYLLSIRVAV